MNNRRELIIALGAGALVAPLLSFAQQQRKVWRVGFMVRRAAGGPNEAVFRQGLRELGYIEGQNIAIEWRYSGGTQDRYREFAAEFVQLNVDCMVTWGINATTAAKLATQTIPIVMVRGGDDPVQRGLVASLARPGGNVTGFVTLGPKLAGKRLQLLKDILPKTTRVAILWDRNSLPAVSDVKAGEAAARALGMQIQSLDVVDADALENAFLSAGKGHAQALLVIAAGFITNIPTRIVNLAATARLPAIYTGLEFLPAGGLIGYGAEDGEEFRGAAAYVDKILKGAKPADLPVQQPTKFEMVINLKTAKALGITIPQSVLVQATKVIR